jgi:hypothetical protein
MLLELRKEIGMRHDPAGCALDHPRAEILGRCRNAIVFIREIGEQAGGIAISRIHSIAAEIEHQPRLGIDAGGGQAGEIRQRRAFDAELDIAMRALDDASFERFVDGG